MQKQKPSLIKNQDPTSPKRSSKPKHDELFRKSLENPLVANEFITTHVPSDIIKLIDIKTLKLEKDSFIEPTLTSRISDVLFSAKFDNQDGYIYLLLEHQSSPDHFMSFRLFKYMLSICDRYIINNPKSRELPLIYPLILYNGTKTYNSPRNLWALFNKPLLAKKFWTQDYKLVNVHEIPDEEFKTRIWSGILEFFLKHIHERQLLKRWQEISDLLPELAKVSFGKDYIELIMFYTLTKIDKDDKIELEKLMIEKLNPQTGEQIMKSLARYWEDGGIEKGIQIGEAKKVRSSLRTYLRQV